MQGCQVSKSLIKTIAEISNEKVKKQKKELFELYDDIKSLADDYAKLESRTKDCVQEVKCYAENLKECAVDFIEDGILNDYRNGLTNIDNVHKELKYVAEQYYQIDVKVKKITEKADGKAALMKKRGEKLEGRRNVYVGTNGTSKNERSFVISAFVLASPSCCRT